MGECWGILPGSVDHAGHPLLAGRFIFVLDPWGEIPLPVRLLEDFAIRAISNRRSHSILELMSMVERRLRIRGSIGRLRPEAPMLFDDDDNFEDFEDDDGASYMEVDFEDDV